MFTYELLEEIDRLLSALIDDSELLTVLRALHEYHKQVFEHFRPIAQGGNAHTQAAAAMQTLFSSLSSVTENHKTRDLFESIRILAQELDAAATKWPEGQSFFGDLSSQVHAFGHSYEEFIKKQISVNAIVPIVQATNLLTRLETVAQTLSQVRVALDADAAGIQEDRREILTLLIPSSLDVQSIAKKLTALHEIYTTYAALLKSPNPLLVRRLEAGSLWVKLEGDATIVDIVRESIKVWGRNFYQHATLEGRIASTSMQAHQIDELLKLSDNLESHGLDTTEIKRNVQEAAVTLSKNLNTLIGDTTMVTIDQKEYSVLKEAQARLSAERVPPRLTRSTQVNVPPLSPVPKGDKDDPISH